ncbi:MAG: zinc-ribbon domain-containing protein [Candidatus Thermoplasmatota archaeon]|nr:zinc-ribbon domain-containing protein [Candidatus Thermoplasmatota archaeon]
MQCGSCGEEIPADSIFCPECGARQDLSRAGGFTAPNSVGLSGQEVSGGRNFGVVSGEAIRQQREMSVSDPNAISPELMRQIAQSMQNQQNIPPTGNFPPPGYQNQMEQQPNVNQQIPMNNLGNLPPSNVQNITNMNPSSSPTDEMVNRLAEAEKAMKSERRNQWLNMKQASASNVLSNLGADLPNHLRNETNAAQEILTGALGGQKDAPNDAFLRRMCEVAVRRVARKRGVAVETPQAKLEDDILTVNITFIDDGRVLDTPDELSHAFEHAIQTEIALKGFDFVAEINLYRSKDGEIENLSDEEDEEEMFACEICDGLVKESDTECPHCGAVFEDEDEEPELPARGPPRGGPPGGPSRGGVPGGPSRGGPPGGPSRGGPPKGPGRSPPSSRPGGPSGGPPKGPSRSPPSGGPKGGPPKGPKRGPPK